MDKPNVLLSAVKKAEDQDEKIVLRLYESEGRRDTGPVRVTLPEGCTISASKQGNLLEKETGKTYEAFGHSTSIELPAWSIETVMLTLEK